MVEGLQIFVLSCREVSLLTFSSLDADLADKLCEKLKKQKQFRRGENPVSYTHLDVYKRQFQYHSPGIQDKSIVSDIDDPGQFKGIGQDI